MLKINLDKKKWKIIKKKEHKSANDPFIAVLLLLLYFKNDEVRWGGGAKLAPPNA
jgi:hypothetical protein